MGCRNIGTVSPEHLTIMTAALPLFSDPGDNRLSLQSVSLIS